jgi:AraC family transcriptional regulator
MGEWLPESGYQPDDRPAYELYHNDPKTHPQGKFIIDICMPVKPL